MAANSPLLRPLAIAAGALGAFQALIWGILSLLGILAYSEAIELSPSQIYTNEFVSWLVAIYFTPRPTSTLDEFFMNPDAVVAWTSLYFSTSVIWIVISGFLLHDSYVSKFTPKIIIGWTTVSAVISVIDFAGMVAFGVDYNNVQGVTGNSLILSVVNYPLVPIFMMVMCARGFILWIMNVGLAIYLGVAGRKLCKKDSPNLLREPENLSRHPSFNSPFYDGLGNSTYDQPKADYSSQGRQNPALQPHPLYAWDIQSPTVGKQQRGPWDFPEKNSMSPHVNDVVNPTQKLPRVGRPVATPVAPLPIPQPDYSPPLRRPVRHEPNMHDAPTRSVLKKANSIGHTLF